MGYINISIIALLTLFVMVDPIPVQSYLIDGLVVAILSHQGKTILSHLDVN